MRYNKVFLGFIFSSLVLFSSLTAQAFVVRHIVVEGNQRIRTATVLNYLTVKVGDDFQRKKSTHVISELYKTGFFDDVHLYQRGHTLVVQVRERAVIGALNISGNKLIKSKDLTKSLKENGISQGMVFDRYKIMGIKHALLEQYFRLGRYNAEVRVTVKPQERNRVAIDIRIDEGDISKIKQIHIIGNHDFTEHELLHRFKLTRTRLWSLLTKGDQYNREKLDHDIEGLKSFYLDRGYLKFHVESVQVEITPDKRDVHVIVNIHEGPIFQLTGYKLEGDLLHHRLALEHLVHLHGHCPFSRKELMAAHHSLTGYLSNIGYAHAVIDILPKVDQLHHTVFIVFKVHPGKPVYVNQIIFTGNTRTQDEVLRRAMIQFESAIFSHGKLEESKRRLSNLGFLEHVAYDVHPHPDHPDQVDVIYHVSEASTASAQAQVGYSDSVGVLYGAGLKQPNFMGTGSNLGLNFEKNDAYRSININYFNPYYTISGIGRGFSIYSTKTTPSRVGISAYSTDSYGASVTYSFPVSIYDHVTCGLSYRHMDLHVSVHKASLEIVDFIKDNGDHFDQFTLNGGWTHSSLDRAIFPTRGFTQLIGVQMGLPVVSNSLNFYKIQHRTSFYYPCYLPWIIHARTKLGYGNGYGRTDCLPFFLNYYAGGIDTVRGLRDNSLGPRDSRRKAIGGNVLAAGSLSLIFPNFISEHLRTSLFVDAGNVFDNRIDFGEIHITGGLGVEWISPFGPLQFSFATPLNHVRGQETKVFQFSIGTSV